MKTWVLKANQGAEPRTDSFVGGHPHLPAAAAVPICQLCGEVQTFFFQVAFPTSHSWSGRSLAVFACTSCADENHFIPEMLTGPLAGAEIPAGFLERYQTNFRLAVFPTHGTVERLDVDARVEPFDLSCESGAQGEEFSGFAWLGGSPSWLLDDEAPGSYEGSREMCFLFQISPQLVFPRAAGAPAQVTLGLDGKPKFSAAESYQLFLGNAIYFFGTATGEPWVYALTQID